MIASRSLRMVSIATLPRITIEPRPSVIGRADALTSEDDAAGRKIRPGNDVDEFVDGERGIVDQRHAGVDDLAEIVRRNVGRHADRDAAGAVDQKVRKFRRQHRGFAVAAVVIGLEIDGVLVDVVEQRLRDLGQPGFGVPHGGRQYRRPPSRNCPARRSGARAWKNPAPCAPAHRRPTGRRADGTYR